VAGVAVLPGLAWQARTAMVDVALAAHLVACVAFALRWRRQGATDAAVGLALSMGHLLGTKYLALSYLAAVSPLLVWTVWSARRRVRRMSGSFASMPIQIPIVVDFRMRQRRIIWMSVAIAAWIGGYWYARNWIVVGNPLFPLSVRAGGITLFQGAFGRAQMVNSPFNLSRLGWHGAVELIHDSFNLPSWFAADHRLPTPISLYDSPAAWLLLLGCLLAGFWSLGRVRRLPEQVALLLTAMLMIAVLWWGVPFQYGRFLWGAVALAWTVVVSAASRSTARFGPGMVWGVLAVWIAVQARSLGSLMDVGLVEWCLSGAVGGLAYWQMSRSSMSRRVFGVATLLCPLVLAGFALDRAADTRFADQRHRRWAGYSGAWSFLDTHVRNSTIAYVGYNLPYFLLGPDLSNHVTYLPPRSGTADRYDAFARDPAALALGQSNISDAAPDRVILDGDAWLIRLRAAGVRWVFVSALLPGSLPAYRHDPEGFTIERTWLDQLAETRDTEGRPLVTVRIFPPGRVRLYEINPAAAPEAFPRLGTVTADETDALDRAQKDGTPPGEPIRFYPHAARAIADQHRRALPKF